MLSVTVGSVCARAHIPDAVYINGQHPHVGPNGGGILDIQFVLFFQRLRKEIETSPDLLLVTDIRCTTAAHLQLALNLLLPHGYVGLNDGVFGPLPTLGMAVFVRVAGPLYAGGALMNLNLFGPFNAAMAEGRIFVYTCNLGVYVCVSLPVPAMHHGLALRRIQIDLILAAVVTHPLILHRILGVLGHFNTPHLAQDVIGDAPWQQPPYVQAAARLLLLLPGPIFEDTMRTQNIPAQLVTDRNNHWPVHGQHFHISWVRADLVLSSTQRTVNRHPRIVNVQNAATGLPLFNMTGFAVVVRADLVGPIDHPMDLSNAIDEQLERGLSGCHGRNRPLAEALLNVGAKFTDSREWFQSMAMAVAASAVMLCVSDITSGVQAMSLLRGVGKTSATIIQCALDGTPYIRDYLLPPPDIPKEMVLCRELLQLLDAQPPPQVQVQLQQRQQQQQQQEQEEQEQQEQQLQQEQQQQQVRPMHAPVLIPAKQVSSSSSNEATLMPYTPSASPRRVDTMPVVPAVVTPERSISINLIEQNVTRADWLWFQNSLNPETGANYRVTRRELITGIVTISITGTTSAIEYAVSLIDQYEALWVAVVPFDAPKARNGGVVIQDPGVLRDARAREAAHSLAILQHCERVSAPKVSIEVPVGTSGLGLPMDVVLPSASASASAYASTSAPAHTPAPAPVLTPTHTHTHTHTPNHTHTHTHATATAHTHNHTHTPNHTHTHTHATATAHTHTHTHAHDYDYDDDLAIALVGVQGRALARSRAGALDRARAYAPSHALARAHAPAPAREMETLHESAQKKLCLEKSVDLMFPNVTAEDLGWIGHSLGYSSDTTVFKTGHDTITDIYTIRIVGTARAVENAISLIDLREALWRPVVPFVPEVYNGKVVVLLPEVRRNVRDREEAQSLALKQHCERVSGLVVKRGL